MEGEYQIKLEGKLIFPDTVNPNWNRDTTHVLTITAVVPPGPASRGCAVGGGAWTGVAPLGLLALALALARARRQ